MCCVRERSSALITVGSGQMAALVLSSKVSIESLQDRVSAGAIFAPGDLPDYVEIL